MAVKCPKCQTENPEAKQFCADCGTQLSPTKDIEVSVTQTLETTPDELTRGTLFAGRYEIIEELGHGGMGRVFRAYDKKIEEEVALKLVRPEIASEKRIVDRLRNEIKTARKIRHANVCGMFDLGEEGKTLFISMEYVRGEDLKSLIRRTERLTIGKAVSIARQVAEGLAEAHKLGIVHRDLKPGNIMIDREGNAKIMDFGIARTLTAIGTTAEGAIVGTPEYMSPEQVEGKPADARSDLYALGVILFEMVTGHAVFEGETPLSIAHKHRYEAAPNPQTFNPQVPANLSRIILRLLEKAPEKRYQTTEELITDLWAIEEALPTADRITPKREIPTSREITVKLSPKNLLIPALAIFLVVAVIVALLKYFPRKPVSPSQTGLSDMPSVAILNFKTNRSDKTLDFWREGVPTSLIMSLLESRYLRVLPNNQIFGILERLNLLEQEDFSSEDLKKVALLGLASHIVTGSLYKAGEKYWIDMTVQNASTLDIVGAERAEGTGEASIRDMIDDLATRLKTRLGLTAQQAAADAKFKLEEITTTSLEAYKYFLEGYQKWSQSPFEASIISDWERAVTLDSQFATAHMWLGSQYYGIGRFKEGRLQLQKAFDLRERVSPREKNIIEADYYQYTSEKTWDKAVDAFSKLIAVYPGDHFINGEFGSLHYRMDEYDKSIERFEVMRQYKNQEPGWYQLLAWCYLAIGQPDKAREVLEGYLGAFGDNSHIRANLAMVYCILGDLEKAKREIDLAYDQPRATGDKSYKFLYLMCAQGFGAIDAFINQWEAEWELNPDGVPVTGLRSYPLALQGKLGVATSSYGRDVGEKWSGIAEMEARYAHLLEKTSDFSSGLSVCETSLGHAREVGEGINECRALYRKGVIQARQGLLEEAKRTADELRLTVESGKVKKRITFYHGLLGVISLQEKNFSQAQDYFLEAIPHMGIDMAFNPRPEFLDYLARAYEQTGRWTEAKKAYEDIQLHKSLFLYGPAEVLIFARSIYKLGKALETMGDKDGAVAKYREFLDLWKDADPGLPEVEDARKRLAGLNGN